MVFIKYNSFILPLLDRYTWTAINFLLCHVTSATMKLEACLIKSSDYTNIYRAQVLKGLEQEWKRKHGSYSGVAKWIVHRCGFDGLVLGCKASGHWFGAAQGY